MNHIVAINGSTKSKDSVSGLIISQIATITGSAVTVFQTLQLINTKNSPAPDMLSGILKADALLIVFPLYVDALPAPLLKLLMLLERESINAGDPLPTVYAVCNCGFYEAGHCRPALEMIENFCGSSGLKWGYGVGIGGGGFLLSRSNNMSKGPTANIFSALQDLGKLIESGGREKQNIFVTPKIPRFIYQLGGNIGWRQMAGKSGLKVSLKARPHFE